MDNNHYGIEAIIRSEIEGGYRLKVSVQTMGMFIDGFRATKDPKAKHESGWWIQQPAFRIGSFAYKPCPEFDKHNPFWLEIEDCCIKAVQQADGDIAPNFDNVELE